MSKQYDEFQDETRSLEDEEVVEPAKQLSYLTLVLECSRPHARGARFFIEDARRVEIGREEERAAQWSGPREQRVLSLTVADRLMSREHLVIERERDGWYVRDRGSKNGTVVNGSRVTRAKLADGDRIRAGGAFFLYREAMVPGGRRPADIDLEWRSGAGRLDTLSYDLECTFADAARIARSTVPVLIRGQTGTGKERVAHELHRLSGRRGDLVAVNCGAIAESLIESELFGYRRGAFSGAENDKLGLIQEAHGGTLFLDEVAELSESSQVTLLRTLQEREILPVGARRAVRVDFRVVAATHQDLLELVEEGKFRRDLYARLAGYTIELPRVRRRREDLGTIIADLLARMAPGIELELAPSVGEALLAYDYPLNVRELEQALQAAIALRGSDEPIQDRHLPAHILSPGSGKGIPMSERALRAQLIDLLTETGGNVSATARAMGKAPMQIRRWCQRFDLDLADYRLR